MFYTNQIKQDIDNKFKSMQDTKDYLLLKIAELTEKNKSLSERLVTLDNRTDKLEADKLRMSKLISDVQDNIMSEVNTKFNTLNNDLERKDIDIDSRLMLFRKEMLDSICSQFFDTLDKIFRTSKEISLIATLINTNGSETGQLRSQLLKPYIDAKHREERIAQGQEIVNKGQKIIENRNAMYEDMIVRQRKGENISNLKFKIEVYDEILKSIR